MTYLRRIPLVYWIAMLLPGIALTQIFMGTSLPDTADGIFHTHRIYAMSELMGAGNLYPRWVPWFHLGYGYPIFNYYASLSTWLGTLPALIGVSAPVAFQLVTAVSWIGGSIGMAALARRFLPDMVAVAAAVLWVYAPVRMHEYWIQGSLSHVLATALVPWVFLTLIDLVRRPTRRTAIQFGVTVGLMILAHQPTTYLTGLYAGFLALILLLWPVLQRKRFPLKALIYLALGGGLAICIAALTLLPLLFELDLIVINDADIGNIAGLLDRHTIPFADQFVQPQRMDQTDLSATIPHTYGLLAGVMAFAGFVVLCLKRRFTLAVLLLAGVVVSVFLAMPAAIDVWHTLPLMDQLRFPWRVMRLGIVPLSLLGASALILLPSRWQRYGSVAIITLTIVLALPTIYPTGRSVDFSDQTAADMIRYEIATGAVGGTSYNEFRPAAGGQIPLDAPDDLTIYETSPERIGVIDPGEADLNRLGDACWQVHTASNEQVDFRQFYFPGWQATLDGQSLPLEAEPIYGLMRVVLPASAGGALCIDYGGTPTQQVATWITIVALVIACGLWITAGAVDVIPHVALLDRRWALGMGGALILATLVNGAWIGSSTGLFRLESPPDDPHYMETPVAASFEHGYDLLGYTLHDDATAPGESLSLTLYWRPLAEDEGHQYYPVVQLENLPGDAAWASTELRFVGLNPIGHTVDNFISQPVEVTVFDDAPVYVGRISVRLIDRATGESVAVASGQGDAIYMDDVIPIRGRGVSVESDPVYTIGDAISLHEPKISQDAGNIVVDLTWFTIQPLDADNLRLFIHALDADGEIVTQIDGPPFGGQYPSQYWQPGQTITQTFRLPDDVSIQQIAIGLYTPDVRLSVTRDGQALADNRIFIDLS